MNATIKIQNAYKTADYEELFKYFFDLYLAAFTKGLAAKEFICAEKRLPNLEIDRSGEVVRFLDEGVSLLHEGFAPSFLSLLLEHLYVEHSNQNSSAVQIDMINLSSRLIKALQCFDLWVLLDMKPIWTDKTKAYAEEYFYCNLPPSVKEKYLQ